MYRFLDRPVRELDPGSQMIVWSMRSWVAAIHSRQCPCATLAPHFARWRVEDVLPDFDLAMTLLNGEGLMRYHFGMPGCSQVHDDEAMLLVLFHAAAVGDKITLGRLVDQLVLPAAHFPFSGSVERFADILRRTPVQRGAR